MTNSSSWQATLGKRIMNIFIGHKEDAIVIPTHKAFFRIIFKYIVILLFILG